MTSNGTRIHRLFWLANALTLVRIPMALALWVAPGDQTWVVGLLVLAGITDVLDGRVARWATHQPGVSEEDREAQARLGAWLDPLCDKLFVVSAVVALFIAYAPPWQLMLLVGLREVALTPLMLVYARMPTAWRQTHPLTADWGGKLATTTQVVALLALLFAPEAFELLAWAAGLAGAVSVVRYARRARRGSSTTG